MVSHDEDRDNSEESSDGPRIEAVRVPIAKALSWPYICIQDVIRRLWYRVLGLGHKVAAINSGYRSYDNATNAIRRSNTSIVLGRMVRELVEIG